MSRPQAEQSDADRFGSDAGPQGAGDETASEREALRKAREAEALASDDADGASAYGALHFGGREAEDYLAEAGAARADVAAFGAELVEGRQAGAARDTEQQDAEQQGAGQNDEARGETSDRDVNGRASAVSVDDAAPEAPTASTAADDAGAANVNQTTQERLAAIARSGADASSDRVATPAASPSAPFVEADETTSDETDAEFGVDAAADLDAGDEPDPAGDDLADELESAPEPVDASPPADDAADDNGDQQSDQPPLGAAPSPPKGEDEGDGSILSPADEPAPTDETPEPQQNAATPAAPGDPAQTASDPGAPNSNNGSDTDASAPPPNAAPTDLFFSNLDVDENDAGAVVASLSADDADAGDTFTYALMDDASGFFEVVGAQLKLKDGVSLDYESGDAYEVTIAATDAAGATIEKTVTIEVADLNEGPTDVWFSDFDVDENAAGAVVATLAADDPDAGDSFTYTLTDDPSGLFEVVGDELKLKDGVSLDYESQDSYSLTVTATDAAGATSSKVVTIAVEDGNDAPTVIGVEAMDEGAGGVAMVAEDATSGVVVATIDAVDVDADDAVTLTLSGPGAENFTLDGNKIVVADGAAFDFESGDTQFELTVTATDASGASVTQTVAIDVADVNEGPTDVVFSDLSVDENAAGAVVATLMADDPDAGETFTYELTDDPSGLFTVEGNELKLQDGASLDHESQDQYTLTVEATDASGASVTKTVTIDVADLNEGPAAIALSNYSVDESVVGATVATLSVGDPDADDTHTFTVSDNRFEVVDGRLKLQDGVSLDYEDSGSVEVTVTATDAGGLAHQETFTINVADVAENIQLSNDGVAFTDADVNEASITGGDGNDTINAGAGSDNVSGGDGDDLLRGEHGHDTIHGGAGDDTIDGGAYHDRLYGGDDNDALSGGAWNDQLYGEDGDDALDGGSHGDTLVGGAGDDTLFGGAGSYADQTDLLEGGAGDDDIDGGDGASDIAIYSGDWSDYTITESNGLYTIVDNRDGSPDGTDTVVNVETFRFADGDVAVADILNDAPTNIVLSGGGVDENEAGAIVGDLSAVDADGARDNHQFTVSDNRFEVVDSLLKL